MNGATEAFARVKIDARLRDAGWSLTDGASVLYEHALPDGTKADYVLCDRRGRPMAALEAKRASIDPIATQDQGRRYAEQLGVPFVFLSNGEEVRFLVRDTDAHAREVAGFYAQDDLERRIAARRLRRDLSTVTIDRRIVGRDYQIDCIEALSAKFLRGRRKFLVEMATGIASINKTQFGSFPVPIPPVELQNRYAGLTANACCVADTAGTAAGRTTALGVSRMSHLLRDGA